MSVNGMIVWSTRGATVGLIITDGRVVDCPPYAVRWAKGRLARDIWQRGRASNVHLTWIPREE